MARVSRPPSARTRLTLAYTSALRLPTTKPRQRIASASSRPGYAESRPWMACGGPSGLDACRAREHAPVGTTLLPKPAPGTPACVAPIPTLGEEPFVVRAPRAFRAGRGRTPTPPPPPPPRPAHDKRSVGE